MPHIVNIYLLSNVWYYASVIDLKVTDVVSVRSMSNKYVHANSALRPETLANYVDKKDGGLGVIHVKSKTTALFVKNLLEEGKTNLYVNAVMRKYCEDEDILPIPVRPPFLSEALISQIKYIKENVKQFDSKSIY